MSDMSGLHTAVTSLHAQRKRIDIISENIANIDTPGYHRQVTRLAPIDTRRPGLFSGDGGHHGGVTAEVSRQWDQLLDTNAKHQLGRTASLEVQAEAMATVEAELGSLDSTGLAGRLQELWNSFDDLANQPDGVGVRKVVLGNAQAVTSTVRSQSSAIERQRSYELGRLDALTEEVNTIAVNIAELDRTIVASDASGNPAHGALDERDRLTSELVSLVGGSVTYNEVGQVRFSVDGYNLVSDGGASTVAIESNPDPDLADVGYPKTSIVGASGRELRLVGGAVHGGLQVVNDRLSTELRALNEFVEATVTAVNTLHAAGTGLDGSTGLNFFDPGGITAGTMALAPDVLDQPEKIAASDGTALLNNSVALALAELGEDPNGPSAIHAGFVAGLGSTANALTSQADVARLASSHAESVRQSAAGVDLDEELADLVAAQRSYEASSRMISTIDSMLDTLINRTGLVGR